VLPRRTPIALIAAQLILMSTLNVIPAAASVAPKVAIIVGPTGGQTDFYRNDADEVAAAAEAAGATVARAYSPEATWANVMAAVDGANIVIYMGHGNGFPSPYSSTENRDRVNGWGLNRTTTNGDSDNWSTTMVYCGEKALLGSLTSSDGAAQRTYCSGGPIHPAPNWVMIYAHACYAPGASEGWDTPATESVAFQRVRNYSYPALQLGAGAYFATDFGNGAPDLVDTILRNPEMPFGVIAEGANGYDLSDQRHFDHPDIAGARLWIQNTGSPTSGDYYLGFAGHLDRTPSGSTVPYTEPTPPAIPEVVGRYPAPGASGVATTVVAAARFSMPVSGVSADTFQLRDASQASLPASVTYDPIQFRATLKPAAPLVEGVTYTLRLSGAITSLEGGPLPVTTWSFQVGGGAATDPMTFNPWARLVFKRGTHTAYQFDAAGAMLSRKSIVLTADSSAYAAVRRTLVNQSGSWLYVVSGAFTGYWLRESPALYVSGWTPPAFGPADQAWSPATRVVIRKGTHTGYRFDANGLPIASKTASLGADSGASVSTLSTPAGQYGRFFLVTNGIWAGYWLRQSDVVRLP